MRNYPRDQVLRLMDGQLFNVNEKFRNIQRVRFLGPIVLACCDQVSETDTEFLRRLHGIVFLDHDIYTCEGCVFDGDQDGPSQVVLSQLLQQAPPQQQLQVDDGNNSAVAAANHHHHDEVQFEAAATAPPRDGDDDDGPPLLSPPKASSAASAPAPRDDLNTVANNNNDLVDLANMSVFLADLSAYGDDDVNINI